jgi:hypothetical protein
LLPAPFVIYRAQEVKAMHVTLREYRTHFAEQKTTDSQPVYAWGWREVGAVCGLATGIIAVIFGSLLTALSWMSHAAGAAYLKLVGTVLLVLTIPLLICGAHCLDLMEQQKDRERKKRCSSPIDHEG